MAKKCLTFFSDEMPPTAIAIDGMEPENDDDITLNTKRSGRASKFGGDDEDSDIGRLAKAIQGSYDNGSPQKEAYFEARTAQIKLQTEQEQEQMGYDTIKVKLSAVMSCSESMAKVASI
jgi:hypothetical protein